MIWNDPTKKSPNISLPIYSIQNKNILCQQQKCTSITLWILQQIPGFKSQEGDWLPHSDNTNPWGETYENPDHPRQKVPQCHLYFSQPGTQHLIPYSMYPKQQSTCDRDISLKVSLVGTWSVPRVECLVVILVTTIWKCVSQGGNFWWYMWFKKNFPWHHIYFGQPGWHLCDNIPGLISFKWRCWFLTQYYLTLTNTNFKQWHCHSFNWDNNTITIIPFLIYDIQCGQKQKFTNLIIGQFCCL